MPWLVAAYVTMLVLVPFDSMELPVPTPIDATLDRLVIGAFAVLLFLFVGASVRNGPVLRPLGLVGVALGVLLLVVFLSTVTNLDRLQISGEGPGAAKRLAYLAGYVVAFALLCWSLAERDIVNLLKYLVGLGVLCALGVMYQQHTGHNVFFDWASRSGGIFAVDGTPVARYRYSRPVISGPAQHPLAVATMLLMIAPFALAFALNEADRRRSALFAVAFAVLVFGSMSTLRRTSVLALVAMCVVLVLYRPKRMIRLLPWALPGYLAGQVVAPGVGASLRAQLLGNDANAQASTQGRASDYPALVPDVLNRPLLGRGYGTYQPESYRVLDNQYLSILVTVGVIGLLAFLLVLANIALEGHRVQRSQEGLRAWLGIAGVAAVAVFGMSCFLFDVLVFPQPVYVLMLVAALLLVLRRSAEARLAV